MSIAKQYSKNIFTFLLCLLYLSFTNLTFINHSNAAKIDAKDPFSMYNGECGCKNLATKEATLSCLKAQLSCGVLFDIPTCKITDSLKEKIKSYNEKITDEDIQNSSTAPSNFKTGIGIIDNITNRISKFTKGAQTAIKGFNTVIKIFQKIRKMSQSGIKIITIFMELDNKIKSKDGFCSYSSVDTDYKNFFGSVTEFF
ncbi:hypothetical protein N9C35_05135, partial [Flavobacteriaceae bacterium]|nr:hypothetical protein [Flavobacteriaceae bacterium]